MTTQHMEIVVEIKNGNVDYLIYKDALHSVEAALDKKKSTWQTMNALGQSPEAILINAEEEHFKLFKAVGKIMKLQNITGIQFLPKQRVHLTDEIRRQWCEDFYESAQKALS